MAATLDRYAEAGRRVLSQTVRIVLNGGLGTSMGLVGPKSLLKVKHGRSFLEILLRQAELSNSRLALMNSFNTHTATLAALDKLKPAQPPLCFLQHKFPKILQGELDAGQLAGQPGAGVEPARPRGCLCRALRLRYAPKTPGRRCAPRLHLQFGQPGRRDRRGPAGVLR